MAGLDSLIRSVDAGDEVRFDGPLTIGRDAVNGMVLGFGKISRRHAVIEWADGEWWVRDLNSRNGTTVDGEPVARERTIHEGDVLRFGNRTSWKVIRLADRGGEPPAIAVIENVRSGLCIPVTEDRAVIGTAPTCDVEVPDWLDEPATSPIRAILFVESGQLMLFPKDDLPGVTLEGEPPDGDPRELDGPLTLVLGGTTLRISPREQSPGHGPTRGVTARASRYDLELVLEYQEPVDGIVRVRGPGVEWSAAVDGNRFILLYLLGTAGGEWVRDADLEIKLWGHRDIGKDTLHKLIYDTRKLFIGRGVDGWVLEKHRGKTRLRLPADRIQLVQTGA